MLDIGFSEIALIFTLALVVLGPEKLPKVAAQVGRWIGRARGMARQFREQLEEEVNLEEARKTRPPAVTSTAPPPAVTETSSTAASLPTDSTASAGTSTPPSAEATPHIAPGPQAEPEQQVYPDGYSHAHPTDSLGRPVAAPTDEPPPNSGQQDWVGVPAGYGVPAGDGVPSGDSGVSAADKPTQTTPAAAYAPSHERGT